MTDRPEPIPLVSDEPPFLDLFMTVVRVMDWMTVVRWYTDKLGLVPILMDPLHEFALLAAGQGRIGLQGVKGARPSNPPKKVRLVFEVRNLDLERLRLIEQGLEVSVPFDNREEGYREIRLHDPDGNSLTLFAWVDPARASRLSRNHLGGTRNSQAAAPDKEVAGLSE